MNEGAALLNDMRRRLAVKDVDGLAALVRQLEYYSIIFYLRCWRGGKLQLYY